MPSETNGLNGTSRRLVAYGSLAILCILVIDALLYTKITSIRNEVKTIKAEKVAQDWADSIFAVYFKEQQHQGAKLDSLFLDLRERLGVD